MEQNIGEQKLLILDDDEWVAETMKAMATRLGFQVRSCSEPDSFFQELTKWDPTHLVIDLVMPRVDGIDILNKLAANSCKSHIIISSGVGRRVLESATTSASELGLNVSGSLPKPFKYQEVRRLLNKEVIARSPVPAARNAVAISCEDLQQALDADEVMPYFQPQISCSSMRLKGFEALARWVRSDGVVIPPNDFIELAERTGLINRLTLSIAKKSIEWMSRLDTSELCRLSINISPHDLNSSDLATQLIDICHQYNFPPDRMTLEIIESSAIVEKTTSLHVITKLRVHGFHIAIDDFGTGYSSLMQLVRLPFTELKIDRSFVSTALKSKESESVVKAVIGLGHSLNMITVAEGVEDRETLDFLKKLKCSMAQGYFITKPMPGPQASVWAREWRPPKELH